jgi:hypothetical protein
VTARSAFIAGNVGKLGGELLNVLLESPMYARVAVGVRAPIRVMVPKLETVLMPVAKLGWQPDDVFLCVEPEAPSFWKSANPYFALTSESAAAMAAAMCAGGASRLAVVTPLEAILQLGPTPVIRNADELAIVNAGYQRVLILRPVAEEGATSSRGVLQSIGGGVVRVLASYMTPRSLQPIRRRQAAQATVELLASRDDGVHIVGAAQLRELVGDPMGGKRLY